MMLSTCCHGLCLQCVLRLKSSRSSDRLACPECRQFTSRAAVLLNRPLLDLINAAKASKPVDDDALCDQCVADEVASIPTSNCFQCQHWLCLYHAQIHARQHKSHDGVHSYGAILADTGLKARVAQQTRTVIKRCPDHISFVLGRHCIDCNQLVCEQCIDSSHTAHRHEHINTALSILVASSTSLIESATRFDSNASPYMKTLSHQKQSIESEQHVLNAMSTNIARLNNQLSTRKSCVVDAMQLMSATQANMSSACQKLKADLVTCDYNKIRTSANQLQSCHDSCKRLMTSHQPSNGVADAKMLSSLLEASALLSVCDRSVSPSRERDCEQKDVEADSNKQSRRRKLLSTSISAVHASSSNTTANHIPLFSFGSMTNFASLATQSNPPVNPFSSIPLPSFTTTNMPFVFGSLPPSSSLTSSSNTSLSSTSAVTSAAPDCVSKSVSLSDPVSEVSIRSGVGGISFNMPAPAPTTTSGVVAGFGSGFCQSTTSDFGSIFQSSTSANPFASATIPQQSNTARVTTSSITSQSESSPITTFGLSFSNTLVTTQVLQPVVDPVSVSAATSSKHGDASQPTNPFAPSINPFAPAFGGFNPASGAGGFGSSFSNSAFAGGSSFVGSLSATAASTLSQSGVASVSSDAHVSRGFELPVIGSSTAAPATSSPGSVAALSGALSQGIGGFAQLAAAAGPGSVAGWGSRPFGQTGYSANTGAFRD